MKPIGSRVVSYGVAAAVGVASVIGYILVTGVKLSNERAKYEEEQRLSQASQPTTDAGDPQNVLILLWDTVRADRMSVYGHDRPTTPYLEQLAEESLVFGVRSLRRSGRCHPMRASLPGCRPQPTVAMRCGRGLMATM